MYVRCSFCVVIVVSRLFFAFRLLDDIEMFVFGSKRARLFLPLALVSLEDSEVAVPGSRRVGFWFLVPPVVLRTLMVLD